MKGSITAALLIITVFNTVVQVTNKNFNEEDDRKDWAYSFIPYALLASQSTDVGTTQIRQSFGDLRDL